MTKKEYLTANYGLYTNKQLSEQLNTTTDAIRIMASKLRLSRTPQQLKALGIGVRGKPLLSEEEKKRRNEESKKRYMESKLIREKEQRRKQAEERKVKALVAAKAKAIVEKKAEQEVKPIKLFEEIIGYHWVAVTFANGTKGMAYRKK